MTVTAMSSMLGGVVVGLVAVIVQALLVVVLIAIVRRILGVRVGWARTLIVIVIGAVAGIPASGSLAVTLEVARSDGTLLTSEGVALAFFAVVTLWMFVACLIVLLILEALAPTGSVPGPHEAWSRSAAWIRRTRRYLQIAWIGVRTGANGGLRGGPTSSAFGETLARFLNRSGVTFIKLGQILANRDDLLPRETTTALSALQSRAEPAPGDVVAATIRRETGIDPHDLFATFDSRPLAAASVAQVHAATMPDGREVVVKVQRDGAREQVTVDTDILVRLAGTVESRWGWARDMALGELATGLAGSLREELDYTREASHTVAGAAALAHYPDIVVPATLTPFTTRRILVLERLRGVPLSDGAARIGELSEERRAELARTLIVATLETILVTGVFHADMHPGNVLVLDDERLGILDFGSVGILGDELRSLVGVLLLAMFTDDAALATSSLVLAFDTPRDVDVERLRRDLGREITELQLQDDIGSDTFARVFTVLRTHGVSVPGDVAAAVRTLVSVEAAARLLDPGTSLLATARGELPRLVRRKVDPAQLAVRAVTEAAVLATVARRLPERVDRATRAVSDGELASGARPFADPDDRRWLSAQVAEVLTAGFGMVAGILAAVLVLHHGGPLVTPRLSVSALIGLVVGFFGVILGLRVVVRIFHGHHAVPPR